MKVQLFKIYGTQQKQFEREEGSLLPYPRKQEESQRNNQTLQQRN